MSAQYIGTDKHAGLSAGVFFLFLYITLYVSPPPRPCFSN